MATGNCGDSSVGGVGGDKSTPNSESNLTEAINKLNHTMEELSKLVQGNPKDSKNSLTKSKDYGLSGKNSNEVFGDFDKQLGKYNAKLLNSLKGAYEKVLGSADKLSQEIGKGGSFDTSLKRISASGMHSSEIRQRLSQANSIQDIENIGKNKNTLDNFKYLAGGKLGDMGAFTKQIEGMPAMAANNLVSSMFRMKDPSNTMSRVQSKGFDALSTMSLSSQIGKLGGESLGSKHLDKLLKDVAERTKGLSNSLERSTAATNLLSDGIKKAKSTKGMVGKAALVGVSAISESLATQVRFNTELLNAPAQSTAELNTRKNNFWQDTAKNAVRMAGYAMIGAGALSSATVAGASAGVPLMAAGMAVSSVGAEAAGYGAAKLLNDVYTGGTLRTMGITSEQASELQERFGKDSNLGVNVYQQAANLSRDPARVSLMATDPALNEGNFMGFAGSNYGQRTKVISQLLEMNRRGMKMSPKSFNEFMQSSSISPELSSSLMDMVSNAPSVGLGGRDPLGEIDKLYRSGTRGSGQLMQARAEYINQGFTGKAISDAMSQGIFGISMDSLTQVSSESDKAKMKQRLDSVGLSEDLLKDISPSLYNAYKGQVEDGKVKLDDGTTVDRDSKTLMNMEEYLKEIAQNTSKNKEVEVGGNTSGHLTKLKSGQTMRDWVELNS